MRFSPVSGTTSEAVAHQDAVLAGERDDVGHGREGDEVEEVERQVLGQAQGPHHRLGQLEGDAGAAEILVH